MPWAPPPAFHALPIRHGTGKTSHCPKASPQSSTWSGCCLPTAAIFRQPWNTAPPPAASPSSRSIFGTARLPFILARLSRGILRATALERVLLARAARGRDLVVLQPRRPAPPPQQAVGQQPSRPVRRSTREELPEFPTLAQLEADIRRRPIGHAIADICRDLGVSPSLCEGSFWNALFAAITWYRGNFHKYYKDIRTREADFAAEWDRDRSLAFDWPEQTRDGIRQALGFFIGEPPVSPFPPVAPPGLANAAATRPP